MNINNIFSKTQNKTEANERSKRTKKPFPIIIVAMTHWTIDEWKKRENLEPADKQEYYQRNTRSLRKHDVWFYDFGEKQYDAIQKATTEPVDFEGDYDIIFVSGDYLGESGANRTTKGTVHIREKTITVELDDEVKKTIHDNDFFLLSDFHVNNLRHGLDDEGSWECEGKAKLEEYEFCFPYLMENWPNDFQDSDGKYPKKASIFQITNRIACPREEEESAFNSTNEDCVGKVEFDTLEEAIKLHEDYKNKYQNSWLTKHSVLPPETADIAHSFCAYRPSPVLLFEPGDLVLEVTWISTYDYDDGAHTYYILRKRKISRKRKYNELEKQSNKKSDISKYYRVY